MPPTSRTPASPLPPDRPGRHAAGAVPSDSALVSQVLLGDELATRRLRGRHEPRVGPYADRLGAPDGPELLAGAWARLLDGIRLGSGLDVPVRVAWLSLVSQQSLGSHAERPWVGGDAAWAAFLSLPPAWQVVLWHAEVEGEPPEVLAALAGADRSSVERWTGVARGALRREVVRRHLPTLADASCLQLATGLLGDLDASASPVELGSLHVHGLGCASCAGLSADVLRVEQDLGRVLAERVLGGDAAWYLAGPEPVVAPAPVATDADDAVKTAVVPVPVPAPAAAVAAAPAAAAVAPAPAPAPRPAVRPAPVRRRSGSLLVGLAAAAVVAGILVGTGGDAPLEADLEAGGRDARTARVAGSGDRGAGDGRTAASSRAGGPSRTAGAAAAAATPVVAPADGPPQTTPTAAGAGPGAAQGVAPAPSTPTGPGRPGTSTPADDAGTGGGGTGDDGSSEPVPAPEPTTGSPGLPLRVSVDRDAGSATVELDPPLLGGNLSLTTPPLGGSSPTGR